ncbi:TIGR03086 family metal-binding protein [Actinomadura decatromicini]|uniref:TIGR03086 family protein n=1 Tax=Actinomadura decatromicini TaxID=2604572 RepID=A0A5D3FMJ6_9ACTN|nr:TIGR03086 family metal-binding protein [Actinomadura decatromicini]TYK49409.1 TIGR03086 family protein [Actinomadura decatromicini]
MHERTSATRPAPRDGGPLERAIGFALTSVQGVTPGMMARPTPCELWDLEALLLHLRDSLAALHEGMSTGQVAMEPDPSVLLDDDPVSAVRVRAVRLLRASGAPERVDVGDRHVAGELMEAAGAIEVAVHGWDIEQASGRRKPIPEPLAGELLRVCPIVVPEEVRRPLFADPVEPAPGASPGDRLVAFLGRRPLN